MLKKIFLFVMLIVCVGVSPALAADCAEVGKKVAAQHKGVLTRSTQVIQDGKNMCVVVVIIPARDGEQLRRIEIMVPTS